jgi:hypothetical protein
MEQEQRWFALAPAEGKAFLFLGSLAIILLTSEQTHNAFTLSSSPTHPGRATLQKIYRQPTSIVTTETLDKLATALGVDARVLIESVLDEDK